MSLSTSTRKPGLAVLKRNFADIHPALTSDEAALEAARCLFCYDAPCTRACPTGIDVPRFIRQILHDNPVGSARTILGANIFGGSCARVCPTEVLCEGACVDNTLLGEPVQIGRLQRFACDRADGASERFFSPGAPTGKRVAVVGAGPAGLTCAHELRKQGHAVDVYEAGKVPGGLNTLGIAAYKISTPFALREVERIERMGMSIHLKQPVTGGQIIEWLDQYDAVFIGVGLGRTAPLHLPGEQLAGVWEALDFIEQTRTKALNRCAVGREVVVIGGGNTAVDVANAAARLGAERVTLAYRRDRASMPAFESELMLAADAGVEFVFHATPKRILGRGGQVTGVRCAQTRLVGRGRKARIETIDGEDFTIPADMVVKALGQQALTEPIASIPGLKLDKSGRIKTDPASGATSVSGLFAGGDCRAGAGEEVVNAVEDGKIAARGIQAFVTA